MPAPIHRVARIWVRLGLNELGPLLTLGVGSVLLWAFVVLAGEVLEGDTAVFDRQLLLLLRASGDPAEPVGPPWAQEAARDITGLGGITVLTLVTLAAFAYLLLVRKRGAAFFVTAAVAGGVILSTLLKMGFDRARPDLVPHAARVFTASFPSGHAMLSAVVYLTLGALIARVQDKRRIKAYFLGLAVLLTLMIGISRLYLGVHWPSDVLAGWCVGAAWAALCWFIELQLQRRGTVERPGERNS